MTTTWKDEHAVVHIVQEEDTGYTDPVFDWVPLCYKWPAEQPYISKPIVGHVVPTCLNCINRGT